MATIKITVTLEAEQVDAVRALVEAGGADSISAFVKHAVGVSLGDVAGWGALLADALEQTGGPLTKTERAWADRALSARDTKKKRKKAA